MADDQLTKYEAERFFGLTGAYNSNDLSRAYRKKVATFHPDVAAARGIDRDAAEELMVIANSANELLKEFLSDSPDGTVECDKAPVSEAWVPHDANPASNTNNVKDSSNDSHPSKAAPRSDSAFHADGASRASAAGEASREVDAGDPREKFRMAGEVPERLSRKYDRVERFPYRLVLALLNAAIGVVLFFIWTWHWRDYGSAPLGYLTIFVLLFALADLFSGCFTKAFRRLRLRQLDSQLYRWRKAQRAAVLSDSKEMEPSARSALDECEKGGGHNTAGASSSASGDDESLEEFGRYLAFDRRKRVIDVLTGRVLVFILLANIAWQIIVSSSGGNALSMLFPLAFALLISLLGLLNLFVPFISGLLRVLPYAFLESRYHDEFRAEL